MWTQIFKYAAGISSGLSLVAFLAALYVWLQSQKSERSILGTIKGKGIIDAETIVQVLKQFSSDESRLEALQKVLGYDQSRASDVLKKVKSDVDVEKFSFVDQTHFLHRLVITGVVLLILAAIAAFGFKAGTIATNVPVTIKSVSQGNLAPARQTILTIMTERCQG